MNGLHFLVMNSVVEGMKRTESDFRKQMGIGSGTNTEYAIKSESP